jgi:hypothetical protein
VYFAIGSPPIAYYTKTQQKSSDVTCCKHYILCYDQLATTSL